MERRHKVILVDGMHGDRAMPALEESEELAKIGADLIVLGCESEDDIIARAHTMYAKQQSCQAGLPNAIAGP